MVRSALLKLSLSNPRILSQEKQVQLIGRDIWQPTFDELNDPFLAFRRELKKSTVVNVPKKVDLIDSFCRPENINK